VNDQTRKATDLILRTLGESQHLVANPAWNPRTVLSFSQFRASAAQIVHQLVPAGNPYRIQMEDVLKLPMNRSQDVEQATAQIGGILNSLKRDLEQGRISIAQQSDIPAFLQIDTLLNRFHIVTQQLKKRHDNRDSLWITDEYDVQDLLHALLRVYFDDIRPEEWTPSYAGKSSRMDFLLKQHRIVIEVKMTREKLAAKEIGDELLIDIARYKEHPDCSTLICFVYDPDQRVQNPAGLKHDLEEQSSGQLAVVVRICQH